MNNSRKYIYQKVLRISAGDYSETARVWKKSFSIIEEKSTFVRPMDSLQEHRKPKYMFTETLYSKDARLNPLEYNILKENKADWQLSTIGISKGDPIWRKYISTNDMKNSF